MMKLARRTQVLLRTLPVLGLFILMAAVPHSAQPATITVRGQYPTIQAAINAAAPRLHIGYTPSGGTVPSDPQ